ncbi:MAG: tetratricopeptide repeat protein [Calditrichaeota bacterium]|nr:tetratricopeptide repeat protein [Calditrichota bacterium]
MIALVALLIRWLHLWIVKDTDLIQIQIIDAAFYHSWAKEIAAGHLIGNKTFFMSPLFPYFTGLIYSILGSIPARLMAVQGLMGVGTTLLIYRWGAAINGRMVGLIAAGITAIYVPFIFYETTLLTATLILFLSIVVLNLAQTALFQKKTLYLWLLGAVIGLSALARPVVLLFIPFLVILLITEDKTTWLKRAVFIVLGALIILFPVGVRNLILGGEFTLTTSSAGMNFYVGNNPDATGLYWEAPFLSSYEPQYEDEEYRRVASQSKGTELTTSQAGKFWFNRSLDWMIHQPFSWLKLLGAKAFYFWNRAEFANNVSVYMGKDVSPLLKYNPLGFWLIAPLGIGGLILMLRRLKWKKSGVAICWTLAYFGGGLIFFVASEYRLPAVLALIVGASFLIVEFIKEIKSRHTETAMRVAALGLLLLPVSNFRTDFIRRGENPRMDYFNFGNTLLKEDRNIDAIPRFERTMEIDPYFAEGIMRLAEAYYRSGQIDKALEIGKRTGLEDPRAIIAIIKGIALQEAHALLEEGRFNAAMTEFSFAGYDSATAVAETTRVSDLKQGEMALREGKLEEALELFKTVNSNDSKPEARLLHNISGIYWKMVKLDSAESYARQAMAADTLNSASAFLLARILNVSGRSEEAERLIMQYTPDSPAMIKKLTHVRAKMDSLTDLRQWKDALDVYAIFGKLRHPILAEDKIRLGRLQLEVGNYDTAIRLLIEAEAAGLGGEELYYHQGRTYSALSMDDDAIAALQKSISIDPDYAEPRIMLARFYIAQGKHKKAWHELDEISHLEIIDPDIDTEYNTLIDSLKGL